MRKADFVGKIHVYSSKMMGCRSLKIIEKRESTLFNTLLIPKTFGVKNKDTRLVLEYFFIELVIHHFILRDPGK